MSILSLEFLLFAACVVLLYYLLPRKVRWMVLLLGSVAFVCLNGWHSALHLTLVALLMWGGALVLQRKRSKLLLALLLLLDLGAMALLKIARIRTGVGTPDSFIDLAGYAACGGEIAGC